MQRAGPSLKSSQTHWNDPGWLIRARRAVEKKMMQEVNYTGTALVPL